MSLLEIKNYFLKVKMASLTSLSAYFNCDQEMLRQMLGHWIRKGCLRKCVNKAACATQCSMKCQSSQLEMYEWVI